jgi:hypothetical protein
MLVYRLLNPLSFVAFKMGRLRGGPSRTGVQGAYLDRYVTDEQRSSRPIFNATFRAAVSWLSFRVARSTVMIQIAALRSRLEKQPTDLRRNSRDLGDGTLGCGRRAFIKVQTDYNARVSELLEKLLNCLTASLLPGNRRTCCLEYFVFLEPNLIR